jgi:hypothetical protein
MADKWCTYAEAAAALGMTTEGVRQRARREAWRKQLGNDGKALILVPDDAGRCPPATPDGEAAPTRVVATRSPGGGEVEVLQARIVEMEARAVELRADLERERAERERERGERLQERERAERLTGEVADLARQLAKVAEEAGTRERNLRDQLGKVEADKIRLEAEAARRSWWPFGRKAG